MGRQKKKPLSRKKTPLRVSVKRDVLTIEIGIDTLAHAALCSEYAFGLMGHEQKRPDTRFSISNKSGFADDVVRGLVDELGEDGSSHITNAIDSACVDAIEDGSEWFVDGEEDR